MKRPVKPELMLRTLIGAHGPVVAAQQLSAILATSETAREGFAQWAVARFGDCVDVPIEGKVS